MEMSAPLRRNSVCGPGCGAIVSANRTATSYAASEQGVCTVAPAKPVPALSERAPTAPSGFCVCTKQHCNRLRTRRLSLRVSLEALLSIARQLLVSAVVGQHEDHR